MRPWMIRFLRGPLTHRKPEQQARLADARVPNQEKFEEVVAIKRRPRIVHKITRPFRFRVPAACPGPNLRREARSAKRRVASKSSNIHDMKGRVLDGSTWPLHQATPSGASAGHPALALGVGGARAAHEYSLYPLFRIHRCGLRDIIRKGCG